jgi:hypothetical protein
MRLNSPSQGNTVGEEYGLNSAGMKSLRAPMNLPQKIKILRVPRLTFTRVFFALFIALGADAVQLFLAAFGWAGPDQAIDVLAMVVISWLIGFHLLLLPTFVLELIPAIDDLPTWTACTVVVVFLRWRQQRQQPPPLP